MDYFEKYYALSLRFLGFRPRSEKELRDYLLKKKADQQTTERILASFLEHKFLDDISFTKWWIEQRTKVRPKSIKIVKMELRQKGISQETIEEVLQNQESPVEKDEKKVEAIIEKRIDKYRQLSRQEIYQKLGGYLARRGFSWDDIKRGIDAKLDEGV